MKIAISEIRKKYKKKEILKGISLHAEGGESIGVLGENGCGKSTLLSILAGAQKCDSGSFLYEDTDTGGGSFSAGEGAARAGDDACADRHTSHSMAVDLLRQPVLRSRLVGYVPQNTPLMEELSVRDNLRLWYPGGRHVLDKELEEGVLKALAITGFLDTQVYKLSGGMKKRVSIGCAVAGHPRILILDEPGAALDLVCKQVIIDYLRDFCRKGGISVMASHEIQEIVSCSRTMILKGGILTPYTFDGDIGRLVAAL